MRVRTGVDIAAPPEKVWHFPVEPDKAVQLYNMSAFSLQDLRRQAGVEASSS